MEHKEKVNFPAIWFSGFFGLGALVHLIRFALQVPVSLGSWQVPLGLSAALMVIFGLLSAGLLRLGTGGACCSIKTPG